MNAKELRDMTVEQLNAKLGELKEELFNLRFQLAINQLDKPHKITEVKHPHLEMTGASRGFSRAAAPVWGFSRGTMGSSGSLSCKRLRR